jgi:hypothetical protein
VGISLTDLYSRHPVILRIVSNLITIGGTTFGTLILTEDWFNKHWAVLPFSLVLVAVGIREAVGVQAARSLSRKKKRQWVWQLLQMACTALVPHGARAFLEKDGKVIRSCIMLPDGPDKLKVWVSYEMDGDPDRQLSISSISGVAGHVFHSAEEPVCFDRCAQPEHPWSSVQPPHANTGIRSQMCTILCVPIFDPYDGNLPTGQRRKLGVLCVDSDLRPDQIGLSTVNAQSLAARVADLLAIVLAE